MMTAHEFDKEWAMVFDEVATSMADWRRQNPRAKLRDIDLETARQFARLQARVVQDVAAASHLADLSALPLDDRPLCPDCQIPLVSRGKKPRRLRTHGDLEVVLDRSHASCPQCGQAFFPSG